MLSGLKEEQAGKGRLPTAPNLSCHPGVSQMADCFWKVRVQHSNSICLLSYTPGWGAMRSMSLKFLASHTPAAKSPKLRIKFLRKSFLSVAKR